MIYWDATVKWDHGIIQRDLVTYNVNLVKKVSKKCSQNPFKTSFHPDIFFAYEQWEVGKCILVLNFP